MKYRFSKRKELRHFFAWLVLSSFFIFPKLALAQDLNHVLKRHFAAVGQEGFKNIRSLKMEVTEIDGFGKGQKYTTIKKRPYKIRKEGNREGEGFIKAFDGDTAWFILTQKDTIPTILDSYEKNLLMIESIIGSPLALIEQPENTVVLVGSGYISRQSNYIVRVTLPDGYFVDFYVDKKDHLIKKMITYLDLNVDRINYETYYDGYRKVGNFMFSYNQEKQGGNGERVDVIVGEIVVGIGASNAIFSRPK